MGELSGSIVFVDCFKSCDVVGEIGQLFGDGYQSIRVLPCELDLALLHSTRKFVRGWRSYCILGEGDDRREKCGISYSAIANYGIHMVVAFGIDIAGVPANLLRRCDLGGHIGLNQLSVFRFITLGVIEGDGTILLWIKGKIAEHYRIHDFHMA